MSVMIRLVMFQTPSSQAESAFGDDAHEFDRIFAEQAGGLGERANVGGIRSPAVAAKQGSAQARYRESICARGTRLEVIVLDAGCLVEWLLKTDVGDLIAKNIGGPRVVVALHLLDVEVTKVLRKLAQHREISGGRASKALEQLRLIPLRRYPMTPLLGESASGELLSIRRRVCCVG